MNPIDKALSDVKFRIPKPILEKAFLPPKTFGGMHTRTPVSLDYRIREAVIDARVMVDCNLVGGKEVTVCLGTVEPQYLPEYKVVWRVPLSLTENRRITRVYSLIYGHGGAPVHTGLYAFGASVYDDAASGLLASHSPIPNVSNAEIRLIGENTIMGNLHVKRSPHLYLRCMIENDAEFNHLPPASITSFSKLVTFAVKSYCYNTLILEIDRGELAGGADLGRFASVVEEYADAEELYQEFFEQQWRKVAIFADDAARKRHLGLVVGGRH